MSTHARRCVMLGPVARPRENGKQSTPAPSNTRYQHALAVHGFPASACPWPCQPPQHAWLCCMHAPASWSAGAGKRAPPVMLTPRECSIIAAPLERALCCQRAACGQLTGLQHAVQSCKRGGRRRRLPPREIAPCSAAGKAWAQAPHGRGACSVMPLLTSACMRC